MCHQLDIQDRGSMLFFLAQYGPFIAGVLIALVIRFVRRRSIVDLPLPARISTAAGMAIVIACMYAFTSRGFFPPGWLPSRSEDAYLILQLLRFVFPLALCAAMLLVFLVPIRAVGPRGSADLVPRTLWSFAPRPSVAFAAVAAIAVIVATVVAGFASRPDDDGRYVSYGVDASTSSASTTIYGWWFSLPCLALVAVIFALAGAGLAAVSRPPFAADRAQDAARRTTRVRGILAVTTGGLVFHLGAILQSLWAASGVRLAFPAEPGGSIELGTSFAAMGPTLLIVSYIATTIGFALWLSVLLSTVPARSWQLAESVRP
jgi:hypothetical protein